MPKKDYHKGKKLQIYLPEEVDQLLTENSKRFEVTKTKIVIDALYSFIGPSARDSIDHAYKINR